MAHTTPRGGWRLGSRWLKQRGSGAILVAHAKGGAVGLAHPRRGVAHQRDRRPSRQEKEGDVATALVVAVQG
jgi:hypothetical protein